MISRNLIKYIRSLEIKKNRILEGVFVSETPKVVDDFIKEMTPKRLIALESWYIKRGLSPRKEDYVVNEDELKKVSFLQHPQEVIGVFEIPKKDFSLSKVKDELFLALDSIRDPGNLGTIIRIADWFGITTIICSLDTVDAYNPKVVQASMGSLAHVNLIYRNLVDTLLSLPPNTPIYVTSLNGKNIYSEPLSKNGVIVMGNESTGVSAKISSMATNHLLIPSYKTDVKADSLNVAIATALTCGEFRRRNKF